MTVNLHSDTQTRPTAAMRAAMAAAEVGDEQRGQDPTTRELERRVAELLGHEAAVFLPERHDVQRDRAAAAHPARRRRADPRPHGASDRGGGGRPGGAVGRVHLSARRRGRHLHGRAAARRAARRRRPLRAALARRLGRADDATWAAGASGRSSGSRRCWRRARARPARAPRRRAADERGRRLRGARRRLRARLRHGLDRLLEGPRRPGGRRARRLARS